MSIISIHNSKTTKTLIGATVAMATAAIGVVTTSVITSTIKRNNLMSEADTMGREINDVLVSLLDNWIDYDIDHIIDDYDDEANRISSNLGITIPIFQDRQCAYSTLVGIVSDLHIDHLLATYRYVSRVNRIFKFRREMKCDIYYAQTFIDKWSAVLKALENAEDALDDPRSFIDYLRATVPDII